LLIDPTNYIKSLGGQTKDKQTSIFWTWLIIMSAHWAVFWSGCWPQPWELSELLHLIGLYFYLQWNTLIRYKSSLSAQWTLALLNAPNGIHSFANQSIVRIIDFGSLYYRLESPLFSSNLNVTGIFRLSLWADHLPGVLIYSMWSVFIVNSYFKNPS